jgi:hypothetical protein
MLRFEAMNRQPASLFMGVQPIKFTPEERAAGRSRFGLTPEEKIEVQKRNEDISARARKLSEIWKELGEHPSLRDASPAELPEVIKTISQNVRDERSLVRANFANIMHKDFPSAELIDENWAYFRWMQVYILAVLEYFRSYGTKSIPKQDKLENEVLDLDYTITAILLGGLASRDDAMKRRFRFLRPDGYLQPGP